MSMASVSLNLWCMLIAFILHGLGNPLVGSFHARPSLQPLHFVISSNHTHTIELDLQCMWLIHLIVPSLVLLSLKHCREGMNALCSWSVPIALRTLILRLPPCNLEFPSLPPQQPPMRFLNLQYFHLLPTSAHSACL